MSYPINEVEYGTYFWLLREIGGYLGYGYAVETWDHEKVGSINSIIQSGVMQFYYPPPLPSNVEGKPNSVPHQWSFLSPLATIDLTAGKFIYDLPEDCSGSVGEFTSSKRRIPIVAEPLLRSLQLDADTVSGEPKYAAVRPKRTEGDSRQQWEVIFFPKPSGNETLEFRYTVTPKELSANYPYPLGGRQYSETILQSCLALAEERLTKSKGPATDRFLERLASAVKFDANISEPDGDVWPDINESGQGLVVDRGYLKRLIGRFFGYGPNKTSWTHQQLQEVNLTLQNGLRKFYNPTQSLGMKYNHSWGFLKPVARITLTSGVYEYDLPSDFQLLDSPLTFAPGAAVIYPSIVTVGEHQIRQRLQRSEASSRPTIAAVAPKMLDGIGMRYKILFWPVPDAAYELTYRYQIDPQSGTSDADIPFGGNVHHQTIIEACLSACEEQTGKFGIHTKLFEQRLAMSISQDLRTNSPSTLGYNRDASDYPMDGFSSFHDCDENLVRYNGIVY